jgi:tetratricopeptide (TPR) repeat protein
MSFTSFLVLMLVLDGQGAPAPKPAAAVAPAIPFEEVARRAAEARERDQLDEAIRWYRRGAQLRPRWDEGLWYLATLLYDQDHYAEGRDAFRRFLAVKPDVGPAWALRGLCEFRLKEYDAALRSLTKGRALGYGTNTAVQRAAWFHEAILRIRASEFELAVQPLTWLARSEPESPRLVEAAGLMLLRLPKLPAEIPDEKRELVTLAGRAAYAHLAREGKQARERFQALIERFPSVPNVHYAYGIFLLVSDSDAALAELRKEIEIQPDGVYARLDLAFELMRRGEYAAALPPAEEAVKLAPGLFATHHALGRALAETGELERGTRELEAAVRLAPGSPEMHFALARAYAKAGRKAEAERERATFSELDRKRREEKQEPLVEAKREGPP